MMRTKTSKESKKVPECDLKIDLSVPKVVLDANDCAKFLDGTGKTSVILVERGGKILPASSLTSSHESSSFVSSSSSSLSSSKSSSAKSLSSSSLSNSTGAPKAKSPKLCHDKPASTGQRPNKVDPVMPTSGPRIMADQNQSASVSQESALSEQSKVILKPPKKRRGNDKGAYEDSSANSMVNGETGQGLVSSVSSIRPMGDVKEAVALRSTPSFPAVSTSSNSLQKHTIENLLQVSPSSSSNNNNNSSSNMNLISGPYSHPGYSCIPHPLHSTPVHDLCSQTTIPHPALPTATSSSSLSAQPLSQQLLALSSPSLSSTHMTSTALHKNSVESLPHSDLNSPHLYSYSNTSHPSHPVVAQVLESDSEKSKSIAMLSSTVPIMSGSSISRPLSPPGSQGCFHRPVEQEEPINLSTSSKPGDKTSIIPTTIAAEDHDRVNNQNLLIPNPKTENSPLSEVTKPDGGKIPDVVPSGVWKQNSDLSYAETNGIPHLPQKQILQQDEKEKVMDRNGFTKENDAAPHYRNSLVSDWHENGADKVAAVKTSGPSPVPQEEITPGSQEYGVESERDKSSARVSKELVLAENEKSESSQEPPSDATARTETLAAEPLSSSSTSRTKPPEETSSVSQPKKSSKKKGAVPMDEESFAMRSSIYTESIEHVIQHFEYVSNPADDIYLTEEEEAILRQQFDDNDVLDSKKRVSGKEDTDVPMSHAGGPHEEKKALQSSKVEATVKKASKSSSKEDSKKLHKEKLSPCMQNVVNIVTFVAADVANDSSPSESGLVDLEALLKSLESKSQKKIFQLSEGSECREGKPDVKAVSMLAKARKTLSDIALFYPSDTDVESVEKTAIESDLLNVKSAISKHISSNESLSAAREPTKSKKPKKRKSDTKELDTSSEEMKNSSESKSTSVDTQEDISKPKKVRKSSGTKKKPPSKSTSPSRPSCVVEEDAVSIAAQSSGESPFQSSCKTDTSDIGESIASTSGGSEQVTPVHEPDTKDEGVNSSHHHTDHESHDTGLESGTEDKDNKPVRHYKKRLDFVKCPQCDHQSRGRSALSRHMKKVHLLEADMPYKCHLCTYGCTKMASLNRHLFTHNVFPCSRCDFKTDERDKLTEHVAEHHKDKLDMKLCKVCNRYIKCESFTIEEHTEKCEGPIPYKCTECSKEFKYASSLRVHYHTHFPDEPKRFKCELCDYRTNYKANLHKHHKNMHASKDRDVQCPDCNKMFSTDDNMRRHRKVHTLVRPFACETCKKTFKTSGALKGHQLIHTATRPFTCNIPGCNRSFRTPKFLKSHQEEYHRLVPKKFFCQVEGCNYSFFKRSHLKRHAITHTGERNYHCTWPGCTKSFRHADNLKVHFRGHTNDKPIQCHLCDFKCKQKNSLFWHKKKVHQIVDASAVGMGRQGENDAKGSNEDDGDSHPLSDSVKVEASNDTSKNDEWSQTPLELSSSSPDKENMLSSKSFMAESNVSLNKSSGGSMDLYEFKSEGESEEEGPCPLRRETVKSVSAAPLPPPPKELLLKNERQEKKERDKVEKAERREQLKKEKADKKEQEKREKADKKEQEKKERLEKKELEKKEREEKKEQEKREKLELKEKEKKEKEELREKEKKEKEEQKEREKKEKEEQKEKEKKDKEEQKEKKKMEKQELKEKQKIEREAQKEKEKKDKERRRLEVKRLKDDAKKLLQKRSARSARGVSKKTLAAASLKATTVKAKRSLMSLRRKSPSRAAAQKPMEEKKVGRGKKKKQAAGKEEASSSSSGKDKIIKSGRKKRSQQAKSSSHEISEKQEKEKPSSRSASPRAASPRAASAKASATEKKVAATGRGKKKAAIVPKRKPSARIKANLKSQVKKKAVPVVAKKTAKTVLKKTVKVGKKGRPGRKKVPETSKSVTEEDQEEEEVTDLDVQKEKENKAEKPIEEIVLDEGKQSEAIENVDKEKKAPARPPSPSSSEEDMLQGKASPYRDFSDAENMEEEEEETERPQSSLESSLKEEAGEVEPSVHSEESPEVENDTNETSQPQENDFVDNEQSEIYPEESSDDEGINDIPLTPPRAPAPPPVESSEDEMEPDAMDSSAPYSTPAPNTPFSVPGPNTPFSVPPPTNLVQQHSVHSEEMAAGASSVTSMDMPSAGSVEMQQTQGSVESHPVGSVEMHSRGSMEMQPHGSVEMHPSHGSVEMHPSHGSVEMHPSHGSVEMHPRSSTEMHPSHGSVEMHPSHGSVEMHPSHGSVEMHPRSSTEMHPSHGSVEMHPHGSVEMQRPHGSVEMHQQGSVELHTQGSVEMHHRNSTEMHPHPSIDLPPHGTVEMHPGGSTDIHAHGNMELHPHGSTDVHSHSSMERNQSHAPTDIPQGPPSQTQTEASIPGDLSSAPAEISSSSILPHHDKFGIPPVMGGAEGNSSTEADKQYFDQYLKNLSAANNQAARNSNLIDGPETRALMTKSPTNPLQPAVPTSVITSLDSPSALYPGQADLRRMEAMVGERHHHDSFYARETVSALSRMPERQSSAAPLLPTTHPTPAPTFDAFPSLNPLHSSPVTARDNTPYLRQQENLFATPPVTSSFMAEAMFQRQSMTTPFLPPPPQPTDRNSLSRIPDPAATLRANNTPSLLRRGPTVPGSEMFAAPTVPQTVPRHPLTNAWSGQEVRPTHWQNPYLPRQPNMATANNPFFPTKENYLASRDFMFDPSAVRSPTERGMFSTLASTQPQDSLQFDRFDLSNFFPSAVTPYGTASSLDYPRTSHTAASKPFDDRYRQTAAAASAALPDFRALPPTSGSTDMFSGIGVNSGFNLYPGNHPMPYHPQHVTDNMNSAFLTHPTTAQHAMLERDYAAAAAHRGLYPHPHQNSSYPFIDDRQYSGSSKLSHAHTTPTTMSQERDLMSRSAAPESQMQDPYRSMLYRY